MTSDLETENTALLQFLYACPVGLVEFAADGAVRMANPVAMQLLLPVSRSPFVMNLFEALGSCAPEIRNLVHAFESKHGTVCDGHRIVASADPGRPRILGCTIVKLSSVRHMAALTDITRQVAQEQRLKEAETWFATLLNGINDVAVLSLDEAGRIDAVTPSVLRQMRLTERDLLGHSLEFLERPEAASSSCVPGEALATAQRDGWHLHEGWHALGHDDRYWCQRLVTMRHRSDGESAGDGYTVVLRAVNRQDRDVTELRQLLTCDQLTGAHNRAHFFEAAERELARWRRYGSSFAIVTMDIDHFKHINDTEGHAAGDTVLRELTRRCKAELRPEDTFARLGGEEFVVLLPSGSIADAACISERLRHALSREPFDLRVKPLSVTASFGCAAVSDLAETVANLLAGADEALYRAKRGGRNQVALAHVRDAAA